jgi:hypothetical protein
MINNGSYIFNTLFTGFFDCLLKRQLTQHSVLSSPRCDYQICRHTKSPLTPRERRLPLLFELSSHIPYIWKLAMAHVRVHVKECKTLIHKDARISDVSKKPNSSLYLKTRNTKSVNACRARVVVQFGPKVYGRFPRVSTIFSFRILKLLKLDSGWLSPDW